MRPTGRLGTDFAMFFAPQLDDVGAASIRRARHIAVVGNFPPTRCGIATFTADMVAAVQQAAPSSRVDVYAMVASEAQPCPEGVYATIGETDREAYRMAGRSIDSSGADALWLQHEFGIFGGDAGEWIIDLLTPVAAPLIVSFHTVLSEPSAAQRRVMEWLIARATRLVVMSEEGDATLRRLYRVGRDQIRVIAHGVPDRPFGRGSQMKAKFGLVGHDVLMTFGLLSPNKGLETVIAALPAIVAQYPDVIYLIAGATHEKVLAFEGEAYRERLMALAGSLGVAGHIRWIDRYLPTDELLDLIEAADIYITPYNDAEQSTSGTLSYAVALGKAVISTPYKHAVELLDNGVGTLVPFGNPPSIAKAVSDLLGSRTELTAMQLRAYAVGRSMIWPAIGQKSVAVVDEVRAGSLPSLPRGATSDAGLYRLCDDTGMFQHAVLSVPDRAHGYCIDDNARALMLAASSSTSFAKLAPIFAAFVQHGWNPDRRRFRNFMGFDRRWLEHSGSEDSCGRTLWALGSVAAHGHDPQLQAWARHLWRQTADIALDFRSPRAVAFAMLGADAMQDSRDEDDVAAAILDQGVRLLTQLYCSTRRDDWHWFEPSLAYDNCRLPHALLVAGIRRHDDRAVQYALESLRWIAAWQTAPAGHFRPIGSNTFGAGSVQDDPFDQQAVDAWATIDAAAAAHRFDRDPEWAHVARAAFGWFFGRNDRRLAIAISASGMCHDGLTPQGLNLNQGAESVLALHLAERSMRQFEAVQFDKNAHSIEIEDAAAA